MCPLRTAARAAVKIDTGGCVSPAGQTSSKIKKAPRSPRILSSATGRFRSLARVACEICSAKKYAGSLSWQLVPAVGQPFEVKAGDGEVASAVVILVEPAALIEAQDGAVGRDGEIGVGAGAGFERLEDRPRQPFVVAQTNRQV